jgi:transcriptional regulator with XRE-family HTH domain
MTAGPRPISPNQEGVPVPNRLRELREERGLSRFRLALELDPPVTERTISRWETRESAIPDDRKIELARVLEVTVEELMAGWPETEE